MWHVPVEEPQPRQKQQQADGEAMPEFLQTGEGMQADGEVRRLRARRPPCAPAAVRPGAQTQELQCTCEKMKCMCQKKCECTVPTTTG